MRILVLYNDRSSLALSYAKDADGRMENEDMESVCTALQAKGHFVKSLNFDENSFEQMRALRGKIDLVFNICDEGFMLNPLLEPHIPAMIELLGIPFTGPDYLCIAICNQKDLTKEIFMQNGIRTPDFQVFKTGDELLKQLHFPLIIKPVHEDGSIGIRDDSVVNNEKMLRKKVKEVIFDYKQPALAEEFIDGRELNVALIGNDTLEALSVSEIIFSLPKSMKRIVNYEGKWDKDSIAYKGTMPNCPAEIDPILEKELVKMAVSCFNITRCRDYCRVDFRVINNVPYVLEVNPNPDISESAGLANMARAKGISYADLIEKIALLAIERYNKHNKKNKTNL